MRDIKIGAAPADWLQAHSVVFFGESGFGQPRDCVARIRTPICHPIAVEITRICERVAVVTPRTFGFEDHQGIVAFCWR